MPTWMIDVLFHWNGAQMCMSPVASRALMLDITDTQLTITNLENLQQLISLKLSMQYTRCVTKGMHMAVQCQESMQRFQIQFYNLSACQEVFDMVHMLIPCQKIPDACLPPSSDMVQLTKQYPFISSEWQWVRKPSPLPAKSPSPPHAHTQPKLAPKPKKNQKKPAAVSQAKQQQRIVKQALPLPDATTLSQILRDPTFPSMASIVSNLIYISGYIPTRYADASPPYNLFRSPISKMN